MKNLKRAAFALLILIVIGGGTYYLKGVGRVQNSAAVALASYQTPEEKQDVYARFMMEGYDTIVKNYWSKPEDKALAEHFQLSLQKALNTPVVPALATHDRAGAAAMVEAALKTATSSEAKKKIALDTLIVALYNLPPIGRAGLLSNKQETSFREAVSNVNPDKDLYKDVGAAKGATPEEVAKAAAAKTAELAKENTPEAKAQIAQVAYAQKVLTNPNTKDLYDAAKIEPSANNHVFGKTLYVSLSKITPTSFIEFGRTILSASTTPGLDSLIIDLRGNIGGDLAFAQNFLGLFLGQNQYAFDLFHQGEYNAQRTVQGKFAELGRYKEIALLTDNMTQSTAEVTTAAMKRFRLAHVVGGTTRGWGTVENTFPLSTVIDPTEKYSMLLVHSLTLREDNQPVQDRGVDPDVNIADPKWKSELSSYFTDSSLIEAIKKTVVKPPLQ